MEDVREEQLRLLQERQIYPVGRLLRSTFDADNHDTLDRGVTGLMIDLAKLPYADQPASMPHRQTLRTRIAAWLGGRTI